MRMLPVALALLPLVVQAPSVLACEEDEDEDSEEHQHHHPVAGGQRRIGVQPLDLTPELRIYFGAPEDAGVLIARVEPNSPAERAGLKVGDIIVRADGEKIDESSALVLAVSKKPPGQTINLEILRNREHEEIDVRAEHLRGGVTVQPHQQRRFFSFDREALREELRVLREHLERLNERINNHED